MNAKKQDFPPVVYAVLAALVVGAFTLAGKVEWWWVVVAPLCIYCTDRFWRRRR